MEGDSVLYSLSMLGDYSLNDCSAAHEERRKHGDKIVKIILKALEKVDPQGLTVKEISNKTGLGFAQVQACVHSKIPSFIKTEWEQIPNREHQLRRRIFLK